MASIRKRKTSRFYWACITGPDGKRLQFSTEKEDPKEAPAAAVAAESALRRHKERPQALREALSRLADEYAPSAVREINGPVWLRQWSLDRKGKVSQSSYDNYKSALVPAAEWLEKQHVLALDAITPDHGDQILRHWAESISPPTANYKLKLLRIALNDAVGRKLIAENPLAKTQLLREDDTIRRPFTDSEIKRLLAVLHGEWLAIVWLGLNTGQRLNDLCVLKWSNVDLQEGIASFHAGKTKRLVSLPLLPPTLEALLALPAPDDVNAPLFPDVFSRSESKRSNLFRKILASIGLARPLGEKSSLSTGDRRATSELSFHSLRHNATSWLKSAGVSDSVAMAIIGHESKAISDMYTHLDIATMRAAMAKVSQFHDLAK